VTNGSRFPDTIQANIVSALGTYKIFIMIFCDNKFFKCGNFASYVWLELKTTFWFTGAVFISATKLQIK